MKEKKELTFDNMCWPNPLDPGELQHKLRYGGELTEYERVLAASYLSAYRALFARTNNERNAIVNRIKKLLT